MNDWFNEKRQKEKRLLIIKVSISIVVIVALIVGWRLGYAYEVHNIEQCKLVSKKRVMAEYSDYSCSIDYEGKSYCETDYWDDPASEEWVAVTIDGYEVSGDPHTIVNGLAIVNYPPRDESHIKEPDFDRFSNRSSNIYYTYFSDGDYARDNISAHSRCMKKLGEKIVIETWYGIKSTINI